MITARLSHLPPASFLGKLLRLPLRLVPKSATVRVRSGLNRGLKWVAGSSIHGCWLGQYEIEKQSLVTNLVKPGMCVFDIGANAGFYTLAFSRLVGNEGHVWAFEPFAENAGNVLRHLTLNTIANVTLVQAAVADREGMTGFQIAPSNSMGKLSESAKGYLVPTISLDAFILDGTPPPDLIKMDVEGAEAAVLEGATNLLSQGKTIFLIALHGDEPMRDCLARLNHAGYRAFRMDGQLLAIDSPFVDEIYALPPNAPFPHP